MTATNDGTFEWRSCKSKRKYGTEGLARQIIADWAKRHGKPLETYQCKFCGYWHLCTRRRFRGGS